MTFLRPALAYKGLIGLLAFMCLAQAYWPNKSKPAWEPSLQNLAYRLKLAGLNLRAVSERHDGLLIQTIFLTESSLDDAKIRSLAIDPSQLEEWRGTVKIYYEPSDQLPRWIGPDGDHTYRHGPYVMFGDAGLLKAIAKVLESESDWDVSLR